MMRQRSAWWFVGVVALAGAAGCGRSTSSTGSNTNWIACDRTADCKAAGVGFECVRGRCVEASAGGNSGGTAASGGAPSGAGEPGTGGTANETGGSGGSDAGAGGTTGGTLVPGGPRLGVGSTHACMIASSGSDLVTDAAFCWGDGLYGQTGSTDRNVTAPRLVPGLDGLVALALSAEHTCALTATGDVYCWGKNDYGQIGGPSAPEKTCPDYVLDRSGYYPCQPTPTRVEGVSQAVRVAVSSRRSCALLASGKLACWGDVADIASFAASVRGAESVTLGAPGVCVTDADHTLSCSFDLPALPLPPVSGVVLSTDAIGVTGTTFGCTLGDDGGVRCFGDNAFGELGTSGPLHDSLPAAVNGATAVAVGAAHACALAGDGSVSCWGANSTGAVGLLPGASPNCGYVPCEPAPELVFGLPPIEAIAAGGETTCALTPATDAAGRILYCWGANTTLGAVNGRSRVPGPWEGGPASCADDVPAILDARARAVTDADHTCAGDGDCLAMGLDIGCDRSCAFTPLARGAAPGLAAAIVDINDNRCPAVTSLGCDSPDVTCPDRIPLPVCINGQCVLRDATSAGCDDACGCEAVRIAHGTLYPAGCAGFDLLPVLGLACGECDGATSAVVVANQGAAAFHGKAVISVERLEGDTETGELPDPVAVTLDLEPGARSQAIHLTSKSRGTGTLRVTASGDCEPLNDASTYIDLPSPTSTTPCP